MIVLQVRTPPLFWKKTAILGLASGRTAAVSTQNLKGPTGQWWRFSKAAINWLKPAMWFLHLLQMLTGWWFQTFFMFTHTWGNDPIWLIFFKWVETTKQYRCWWLMCFFTQFLKDYELHWHSQVDELSIGFLKDLVPKLFCFESLNIGRVGRQMDRWVVGWIGILWYMYIYFNIHIYTLGDEW